MKRQFKAGKSCQCQTGVMVFIRHRVAALKSYCFETEVQQKIKMQ